jgi:aromatic ring-opening dioxygenase LigB subunit
MTVLAAIAVPHPPLIFPEVGKGREKEIQKTIDSYREAMKFLTDFEPDTIILLSPHMRWYADYFHVEAQEKNTDNFAQFGAPEVKITAEADENFIDSLNATCREKGFPCGILGDSEAKIDHGSFIPLRFLNEVSKNYKVVRIAISGMSIYLHYLLGQILNEVSTNLKRRSVIIASGDWSHKLTADGPYGFAKEGPEFDSKVREIFKTAEFLPLLQMSPQLCEAAGECGHRPFVIMAGAFDSREVKSNLLSYEGPFGVGYGVATFAAGEADAKRNFGEQYRDWKRAQVAAQVQKEDAYVRLARYCIENFVLSGQPAPLPQQVAAELVQNRAGVFVSLKMHGQLRGCIGTIAPVYANIADEIAHNAIGACS